MFLDKWLIRSLKDQTLEIINECARTQIRNLQQQRFARVMSEMLDNDDFGYQQYWALMLRFRVKNLISRIKTELNYRKLPEGWHRHLFDSKYMYEQIDDDQHGISFEKLAELPIEDRVNIEGRFHKFKNVGEGR